VCLFVLALLLGADLKLAGASESIAYSPVYSRKIKSLLQEAVRSRLGLPYRPRGTDDRGYDCSGFVWRVFHDAGIELERGSARKLWQTLPKATEEEESQFGTLVFFKGLNHVGIVRDADWFYHASSSQGVVRSPFDGYWGARVIGYRRVFVPVKRRSFGIWKKTR
jgi:cell wall-associated NlpC family hydrolase